MPGESAPAQLYETSLGPRRGALSSPSQHPTSLFLLNSFQDRTAPPEVWKGQRTEHTSFSLHLTGSGGGKAAAGAE